MHDTARDKPVAEICKLSQPNSDRFQIRVIRANPRLNFRWVLTLRVVLNRQCGKLGSYFCEVPF